MIDVKRSGRFGLFAKTPDEIADALKRTGPDYRPSNIRLPSAGSGVKVQPKIALAHVLLELTKLAGAVTLTPEQQQKIDEATAAMQESNSPFVPNALIRPRLDDARKQFEAELQAAKNNPALTAQLQEARTQVENQARQIYDPKDWAALGIPAAQGGAAPIAAQPGQAAAAKPAATSQQRPAATPEDGSPDMSDVLKMLLPVLIGGGLGGSLFGRSGSLLGAIAGVLLGYYGLGGKEAIDKFFSSALPKLPDRDVPGNKMPDNPATGDKTVPPQGQGQGAGSSPSPAPGDFATGAEKLLQESNAAQQIAKLPADQQDQAFVDWANKNGPESAQHVQALIELEAPPVTAGQAMEIAADISAADWNSTADQRGVPHMTPEEIMQRGIENHPKMVAQLRSLAQVPQMNNAEQQLIASKQMTPEMQAAINQGKATGNFGYDDMMRLVSQQAYAGGAKNAPGLLGTVAENEPTGLLAVPHELLKGNTTEAAEAAAFPAVFGALGARKAVGAGAKALGALRGAAALGGPLSIAGITVLKPGLGFVGDALNSEVENRAAGGKAWGEYEAPGQSWATKGLQRFFNAPELQQGAVYSARDLRNTIGSGMSPEAIAENDKDPNWRKDLVEGYNEAERLAGFSHWFTPSAITPKIPYTPVPAPAEFQAARAKALAEGRIPHPERTVRQSPVLGQPVTTAPGETVQLGPVPQTPVNIKMPAPAVPVAHP